VNPLRELAPYLPLAILALSLLVLAILVFLVGIVLRARRQAAQAVEAQAPEPAPAAAEPAAEDEATPGAHHLRQSFRLGVARLEGLLSLRSDRTRVPWVALIGQTGSRPDDLLADAGLGFPFGRPDADDLTSQVGCRWWFVDRGVVLDLAGEYVLKGDGLSADERGWRTFVRLLQRYRPQRPIDSFVVTVGCGELLDAGRGSPDLLAALERTAAGLYAKLWRAQQDLGLRCPVYLLITGCGAIEGFADLATHIPEGARQGMLGWSSPYDVDRGYQSRWLDEAFAVLHDRLRQAQIRIFSAAPAAHGQDGVFVFPVGLEALRAPLRLFLSQLFKASLYHAPMLFRGFYLCGSVEGGGGRETRFLKDLFERKVFPEARLAEPTPATLLARNRRVRLTQATVAVLAVALTIGTWIGDRGLRLRKRALKPYLEQTAQDLVGLRPGSGAGTTIQPYARQERAFRLFDNLSRLDARRYRAVFLPSSWFTDFDDDLIRSFVRAYDAIVFTSLGLALQERAEAILKDADVGASAEDLPAGHRERAAVRDQPAFLRLQGMVSDLGTLERHARAFDAISQTRSLDDLAGLVDYLFNKPLPADFFQNAALYREALSGVRYRNFDFARFVSAATRQARRMGEKLDEELFRQNPLVATLEDLAGELTALGRDPWTQPDAFRKVVDLSRSAQAALSRPDFQWVFRDSFDLGPDYRDVLTRISESPFFAAGASPGHPVTSGVVDDLRRQGEQEWGDLRRRLAGLESPYTGPLLEQRDGQAQMQLAPDVLVLDAALGDFVGQTFMIAAVPERGTMEVPAGAQVRWDIDRLNAAADLYEPFRRFSQRDLSLFPASLRPAVEQVADQRVADQILDLIDRARTVVAAPAVPGVLVEDRLATDVAAYLRAGDAFRRLLTTFSEMRQRDEQATLADLFAEEGVRLLRSVDSLLDRQGLYLPRRGDLDGWAGTGNLALRSFDVKDAAELKAFLDAQRERMQSLATDYAKPLVALLSDLGASDLRGARELVVRWNGILGDFADYKDKKPGNALGEFESMVLDELPKVAPDRCPATAAGPADAGHFFAAREAGLRYAVAGRCRTLAVEQAVASYRRIADFFNQRLAGRFPFASAGDGAARPPEAGAEAVRKFFHLFDAVSGDVAAVHSANAPAAAGADGAPCARFGEAEGDALGHDAVVFLCRLQQVRDFLAPYLDAKAPVAAPTFDFEVEFRVNRGHERLGDQIVDWEVDVGDQRIDYLDPQPAGRWTLGTPIEVTLRWASGSSWAPVAEQERPELEVHDRTAVFHYRDLWSLVSLVDDHRGAPADFDGFVDARPHTLLFALPTRREETAQGGGEGASAVAVEEAETRVFIRLSLVAPESKQPLVVPGFPTAAPSLAALPARAR
jgi:type VI secretion system protein ImpL